MKKYDPFKVLKKLIALSTKEVGCVHITFNPNFNPNINWGGYGSVLKVACL